MKNLKQFIGIYPVSKTLRFELRPVGKTQKWIEKNKVLENDESKAADYPVVKNLIDEYHKVCIRESMMNIHIDWNPLKEVIEDYQKTRPAMGTGTWVWVPVFMAIFFAIFLMVS